MRWLVRDTVGVVIMHLMMRCEGREDDKDAYSLFGLILHMYDTDFYLGYLH